MKFIVISLGILLAFCADMYAQDKNTVFGMVTEHSGKPIPGATVYLATNKTGTATDNSGRYTIDVPAQGVYVLLVSFIGFETYKDTLHIAGQTNVNIKLLPDVVALSEVVVRENYESSRNKKEALRVEVIKSDFLLQNNAGNLMKTIEKIPGIYSMDIGSGFSKPIIRGMGFNRIAVSENGIKQESQQWGADHGLEIDQFNVGRMEIYKGPMSLQYGSDAIGGVLEILPESQPKQNKVFADILSIYRSNNNLIGISAMVGVKRNKWYLKNRYTEQHFGDYRIPTDTIHYLTWKLPVYKRKLKNTAGMERDIASTFGYTTKNFATAFTFSNVYQKIGFFPGSHGVPDVQRVTDDGNSRNIEYPFSNVNHLKLINNTEVKFSKWSLKVDLAWQNNHRQEWAKFHTHYGSQLPPANNPDLELDFKLNALTGNIKMESKGESRWKHTFGINTDYQENAIDGFNFLLPQYKRTTFGLFVIEQVSLSENVKLIAGARADRGNLDIKAYRDAILEEYLTRLSIYSPSEIAFYSNRSRNINKWLTDFSGSLGFIYTPDKKQIIKVNSGRSFRLPAANELASNGVHHGTFRHESGDPALNSEIGYQLDLSYTYETSRFYFSVNPFVSWFSNYIFLEPTGEWSILPHAGQIYQYKQAEALIGGGELSVNYEFMDDVTIESAIEYVYLQNQTDGYPLPFSPPPSVLNGLIWHLHKEKKPAYAHFKLEHRYTMQQNRIARNEITTPAHHVFDFSLTTAYAFKKSKIEANFQIQNLFDTKHYNHLSYYRKLNIPEMGRNFQLTIKCVFN